MLLLDPSWAQASATTWEASLYDCGCKAEDTLLDDENE